MARMRWLGILACAACGRIGFDSVEQTDASPASVVAVLEAESGTIEPSFAIAHDALASGGAYVIDGNIDGNTGPGSDTLAFTIPADGTYYIWGRTIATETSDDSFRVAVDGGNRIDSETAGCAFGTAWQWAAIRDSASVGCPPNGSLHAYSLAAGAHTLVLTSREGQSQVDKLVITSDPAFQPRG